jgi:hypothetical protein
MIIFGRSSASIVVEVEPNNVDPIHPFIKKNQINVNGS